MKSRQDFVTVEEYALYLKTVFMSAAIHAIADNDMLPNTIAFEASRIAEEAIKKLGL